MVKFRSIVIDRDVKPQDFESEELYYDSYWSAVIDNPLMFLTANIIVFWGFEVKLSANEYNLLKSIVELNSHEYSNDGYSVTQISKNIDYRQTNLNKDSHTAIIRNLITLKSSIKRKILDKIVEVTKYRIEENRFNPFVKGTNGEKTKNFDSVLDNSELRQKILKTNLNLTMLFPYLTYFFEVR